MPTPRTAPRFSLCALAALCCATPAAADAPLGWIHGDFVSAYTQDAGTFEITAEKIKVNDTIDFLDIRDELLAGTRRLEDDSGDLDGWHATVRYGILETLDVFYQRHEQDLTLKLGEVSTLDITDIDQELRTTRQEAGLKWTIYQAGFQNTNEEITAASIELAWVQNESEDFNLNFDAINFNQGGVSGSINFPQGESAGINNLKDDGWRARFIYTRQLVDNAVGSIWLGYSDHEASSGTGTTIPIAPVADAVTQRFDVEESHILAGLSFNWQIRPRLPFQLSYEYIHINSQNVDITQGEPFPGLALPGFLSSGNLSQDDGNHTLSGSLTWWVSPRINLGLTGKLSSHQFLGTMPHYNNPLSASFSDTPYGYLGLRLGLDLL